MLGRLQMSVSEAIGHYGTLAQRVFSDTNLFSWDGKFKPNLLEEVIKEIVQAKTGDPDALMMDPRPESEVCRTYALPGRFFRYHAD
jgi:hypothetical protein